MHWRSGSDLELCVHAHGHEVDLIMEAAHKNNSPWYKFILYLYLVLCNRCPDHDCSSLTPFRGQVKALVLQIDMLVQPLYRTISSITSTVSRISSYCTMSYELFDGVVIFPCLSNSTASELSSTETTKQWIDFARWYITLSALLLWS